MSAIEVKNLVKKFHGQTVLHGIDLNVQEGEVVAIIGPAGPVKRRCCAVLICWNSRKAGPSGWAM
ncbi:Glutamine transport ATP-binding protein GlnQ [Raoultella planticola]|uniref:Glutamine transport ATP-binding protein GlnQ n=1 Tax=Raoultella planticola TaxID=575 RepID=A0A485AQC6_RAOPL|nr:Glutamine transport ATP-binding protein GlnQ [Raoultella planticola]